MKEALIFGFVGTALIVGIIVVVISMIAAGIMLACIAVKKMTGIDLWTDKIQPKIEGEIAKRERKARLKEKYGFDSSYDKYIA